MKIRTSALLAAAIVLAAVSCTKRSVQPEFDTVAIDTLIDGNGFACDIGYRFASIRNASASPALEAIEQANIGRFFELEEFCGTAQEAARQSVRQVSEELAPPAGTPTVERPLWKGEISAESEGSIVDTLLCYVITRSSYTGGAHGIYGTECYTYSLAGGYEITTADLFTEAQIQRLDRLIREDIYKQYEARTDEELEAKGFFPEYIRTTENFLVTPEGITFYYNPYEIGCYALGAVEVSLSREELAGL